MSVITIYKNEGETPLEALGRLRERIPLYKDEKLSYAGRLDPLAEGIMIVVSGDDVFKKDEYLGLDKTYVTEVLCGVRTDTGDMLGKIHRKIVNKKIERLEIEDELEKFKGKMSQKYPVYSSKSFKGSYEDVRDNVESKKLSSYQVERNGVEKGKRQEEYSHEVEIYSAEVLDVYEMGGGDMLNTIKKRISVVNGDFRQKEIQETWEHFLHGTHQSFQIIKIKLTVSSGFYVRQFAIDLGEQLGMSALAYSITRESVGEFTVNDCV